MSLRVTRCPLLHLEAALYLGSHVLGGRCCAICCPQMWNKAYLEDYFLLLRERSRGLRITWCLFGALEHRV